jgi:Uma2 family endonuclease
MRDAGILGEEDRVELLEGLLVPKMTKNPRHRLATRRVRAALERVVPPGFYVDSQEPVTTGDSEPEPDVSVVRGSDGDYADRHPGPADVALVVEVADESLSRDRGIKLRAYAAAGIAHYWILDLRGRRIEVYDTPSGGAYANQEIHAEEAEVALVIDDREVARLRVSEMLPG